MTTISEKIAALNRMVIEGRALEAFEKFYHPEIVMQENETPPTIGKDANRKREEEFFANITAFRSAEVRGVAVAHNLTAVIWHYDYTHREWGARNYTQVSVQHWQDGLIVREQFFYAN